MSSQIRYLVNGRWAAGERGVVTGDRIGEAIEFAAPPEFRGEADFWTPEHFLLAAVASCFVVTFRGIAAFSRFDLMGLDVSVEGQLDKGQQGYEFTKIVLRPRLTCGIMMEATVTVVEAQKPELQTLNP